MRLLLFPLAFLIGFALLSSAGLGEEFTGSQTVEFNQYPNGTWLADGGTRAVCYENGTAIAEAGHMYLDQYVRGESNYRWVNASGSYAIENEVMASPWTSFAFNIGGSLGIIGIVVALVAVGIVAGMHFFGFGLNEFTVSMIFKSSTLIGVWLTFSAIAYPMIIAMPFLFWMFYFFLTAVYGLGVINSVGHPGAG